MWKYFGDSRFVFVVGQAFVMQVAHPMIDSAVETESTYKEDPWGRVERSFKYLWPVVYSRPEKAIESGVFLREWHRDIKGTDKNGKKYFAFDPEAYAWVHITAYEAMVRMAKLVNGKDLPEAELNQLYEEWLAVGLLLGCREQDMPATKEDYWVYYNNAIKTKLEYTDSVDYWMSKQFFNNLQNPSPHIPNFAWSFIKKPTGMVFDIILRASLPEEFRKRFDVKLNLVEKQLYKVFVKAFNVAWPVLPLRFQYVPNAFEGVKDSRENPAAFKSDLVIY